MTGNRNQRPSAGERLLAVEVVEATLSGALARGLDPSGPLREAGLSPHLLKRPTPGGLVSSAAIARLAAVLRVALRDEALGFLRHPLRPGFHAHFCRASITSDTVREAYMLAGEFLYVAHEDLRFRLVEAGDQARIYFKVHSVAEDVRFFIAMMFQSFLRWTNWLLGRHVLIERFEWRGARPPYHAELLGLFPCPHEFDRPHNCVWFHRRFLDLPVVQTAESLKAQLAEVRPNLAPRLRHDTSMTTRVRHLVRGVDPSDMPSLSEVAKRLAVGVDTLGRRLKAEGNSFAEIAQSVRHDRAIHLLTATDEPLAAIALELGYSEPSSFSRAFKKHTGSTPGAYRSRRRRGPNGS